MNQLSIVILNFNGRHYLERFLPGVVQHSQGFEVVVIDNASSDDSINYLQTRFPKVKLIALDKNRGFSGGYNAGIPLIESTYIVLLNSDIEVTQNWIPPILDVLESDPEIAAIQPKVLDHKQKNFFEYAGASGGFVDLLGYPFCRGRIFHTLEEDHGQYNDLQNIFWASGSSLFIRRDAYLKAGGLDEDFFAHMEEVDLCWRLWNSGYRIMVCPESTVYHVGGGTLDKSHPRKTYLNFRNGLSLIFKNEPTIQLIWKFPVRVMLDWLAMLYFSLKSGAPHGLAILRAQFHFFLSFGHQLKKRNAVKRTGSGNPRYRGLLIWQYFVRNKKTYSRIRN